MNETGTTPPIEFKIAFNGRSYQQEMRYSICRQYLLAYLCGKITFNRLKRVVVGTRRHWKTP